MDDKKPMSDSEDVPSDFFDDFQKDEFIQGLSVIDSWDDEDSGLRDRSRINAEAIDGVKDLRELIGGKEGPSHSNMAEDWEDEKKEGLSSSQRQHQEEERVRWSPPRRGKEDEEKLRWSPPRRRKIDEETVKWSPPRRKKQDEGNVTWSRSRREKDEEEKSHGPHFRQWNSDRRRSDSASRLDSYIQPGSRRDPNKTNEAIKKDKEVKVKEYLAKHLGSTDDIRPPGTELDDYYNDQRMVENVHVEKFEEKTWLSDQAVETYLPRRSSPRPQPSPQRSPRWSPHCSPRWSPHRHSPYIRSPKRRSPQRRSPYHRFGNRYSPQRHQYYRFRKFNHFNPHKYNPYQSRGRRSRPRSPGRQHARRRSPVREPEHKDDFLYPKSQTEYAPEYSSSYQQYPEATGQVSYPSAPEYLYSQSQGYSGYPVPYGNQQDSLNMAPVPLPVPAPNVNPDVGVHVNPTPAPSMVPAPIQMTPPSAQPLNQLSQVSHTIPTDPLAQLVAEGKLSHEDYLKLAPNKGFKSALNAEAKITVIKRCNEAIKALNRLSLPTRLLIDKKLVGLEQKTLAPKFCSPLKRQVTVEFHFTNLGAPTATQQNKQVVDNIITAIGLEKVVERPKKKRKNMRDAAVQTTKPSCDMCEIRNATKYQAACTSTKAEYFTSTVHTQVDEQDLFSSKAVFNPTGSAAVTSHMSIAHLTPAQLVSQLAARAKTLKQPADVSQAMRQNSPYNIRGPGHGSHYQENYANYRY